ncbi:hypothetical protein ACOMHN_039611 [Nucella lapillus]
MQNVPLTGREGRSAVPLRGLRCATGCRVTGGMDLVWVGFAEREDSRLGLQKGDHVSQGDNETNGWRVLGVRSVGGKVHIRRAHGAP